MMGPPHFPEIEIPSWEAFCADYIDTFFDDSRPGKGRSYVIEVAGAAAGHISYSQLNRHEGWAELDIWMASPEWCGKGYGADALVALSDQLHRTFGLTELIVRPSRRNIRALRSYERAGFVPVTSDTAVQLARYGPNEYHDTIVLHRRYSPSA